MRYIAVDRLKEGMVLGQPLYSPSFEILLAEGMKLSGQHIRRINDLGYPGVYIWDQRYGDVVLRRIVPEELRVETIRAAKSFLESAQKGFRSKVPSRVTKEQQEKVIMPLIRSMIVTSHRLVDVVDIKPYDDYSYYHAASVVQLSLAIGLELGISGNQLYELGMAALLHDVGNAFVPEMILRKSGKLTPEEYEEVKAHSEKGFEYLRSNYDISIEACSGTLQHHENYDGTGYPAKLKKNQISIYGRILAVADTYDAMVSRRPYREALMAHQVLHMIEAKAGTKFDPSIVKALQRVVAPYPVGICVELSGGERCIVVQNSPQTPDRPRLRMLDSPSHEPVYLDLSDDQAGTGTVILNVIE